MTAPPHRRCSTRRTQPSGRPDGTLFTPDIGNATIRRVASGVVSTFAGAEKGTFVYPMDIAWAKDGRLLVADAGNHTLRAVTPEGTVATIATEQPARDAARRGVRT